MWYFILHELHPFTKKWDTFYKIELFKIIQLNILKEIKHNIIMNMN